MRGPSSPVLRVITAMIALAAALTACSEAEPLDPPRQPSSVTSSPFMAIADSSWTAQVPANAAVDPNSASYTALLRDMQPVLAVRKGSVPVYAADATSPRYTVRPTAYYALPQSTLTNVPIPQNAAPDPSDDGHMAVVDNAEGCVFDFYRARRTADGWTAEWVNATPSDGNGIYPDGLGSRASGFSAAAGLVWPEELRAGRIDHALVFAYPLTRAGAIVGDATATDGLSTEAAALPIGAHLVLDRSIDVNSLALQPAERTIAKALQEYGMVLAGSSGSLKLFAAHPQSFAADPYENFFDDAESARLSGVPFDRMKVLNLGPSKARYSGSPIDNRCTKQRRP